MTEEKRDLSLRSTRMSELKPLEFDRSDYKIPYAFGEDSVLQRDASGTLTVHNSAYPDDLLHAVGRTMISNPGLTEQEKGLMKLGITMALVAADHKAWRKHQYGFEKEARKLVTNYTEEDHAGTEGMLEDLSQVFSNIEDFERKARREDGNARYCEWYQYAMPQKIKVNTRADRESGKNCGCSCPECEGAHESGTCWIMKKPYREETNPEAES
jgi:hypothetical protein